MSHQNKPAGSRSTNGVPRSQPNYPQEPIGTRPSYVGEVIALVRDGTEEIKHLLESECDLRFNCKVCGSILPTSRSFIIHKRQFCITKFVDYQRRNVSIMERLSHVVSFETRGLQTDEPSDVLEIGNPLNASLLVPLPIYENGLRFNEDINAQQDSMASEDAQDLSDSTDDMEVPPPGVEVIQPARPPADGLYRFGMGSLNLMAGKKKRNRVNNSAIIKRKKTKAAVSVGSGIEQKSSPEKIHVELAPSTRACKDSLARSKPSVRILSPEPEVPAENARVVLPPALVSGKRVAPAATIVDDFPGLSSVSGPPLETGRRSKRFVTPNRKFDGFYGYEYYTNAHISSGEPFVNAKTKPILTTISSDSMDGSALLKDAMMMMLPPLQNFKDHSKEIIDTHSADVDEKDIKHPMFVRRLLDQLAEVADYTNKTCRECSRIVVSIYNLDRHIATQHLGLREAEYSLISKELRRLRGEVFGSLKTDESVENGSVSSGDQLPFTEENVYFASDPELPPSPMSSEDEAEDLINGSPRSPDPVYNNNKREAYPTSSKSSQDSESITERLSAIIRNPNTLKEILTTKEKDQPQVDYQLEDLVDIHRQMGELADHYLQCCRICNKQYFDVYVLNRHIMTVHLRVPEKSCGTINKMIKDSMKRYPHAFVGGSRGGLSSGGINTHAETVLGIDSD